ncbi:GNAT family protein [Tistrella mobilis]|uniref:GNAT family N-acetyltransferase n=1 Tax=Tistrella mobilis TaxID=171437 RepID=UPI0031F71AC4
MEPVETDRLVLRNFRKSDAAGLFAYLEAPVAGCFLSLRLESLAAAEAEAEKRGGSDEYLAVCLKQTDSLIGDVFAMQEDDTWSVGWNFNPAWGGRGYALEAARALFGWLFSTAGARRLYAYVEDHNLASQRLCERLGMRREGLFLDFVSFRTDATGAPIYENTFQYALLRREWEAGR